MRLVFIIGLFCLTASSAFASPQRVPSTRSRGSGPQVVPPDRRIDGKTYAEWSAAWWQWNLSLPAVPGHPSLNHPAFDVTLGQTGNVWFLAAPFGETVQRTIAIPAGTRLFVALAVVDASSLEPEPFFGCTAAEQAAIAQSIADCIEVPFLEIDGVQLRKVRRHRFLSPQFDIILPSPNFLFLAADTVSPCTVPPPPPLVGTAVSDGYWAMIRPLPRGQHTIHMGGTFAGLCGGPFVIDTTYHVTVY